MKKIFDDISYQNCKNLTQKYSTSFSLGIKLLDENIRNHIYAIYGFVRIADEIVDTFHDYDKETMLLEFEAQTYDAIEKGISTNLVLNAFQNTVNKYNIDLQLIDQFLYSMKMDLKPQTYNEDSYKTYIYGSAEVVGLMCLKVFEPNNEAYNKLVPFAKKLGAAFQKVNFLRDASFDNDVLKRNYFPVLDFNNPTRESLHKVFEDIEEDFKMAKIGILKLPNTSKFGVYLAYKYYYKLFLKIKHNTSNEFNEDRIRIPNYSKMVILFKSFTRHKLNYY